MFCSKQDKILKILQEFKKGGSHLAIVTEDPDKMRAVIEHGEGIDESFDSGAFKDLVDTKEKMVAPKILGLVTIEDILEMIINDEIYDEADYDENHLQNIYSFKDYDEEMPEKKKTKIIKNLGQMYKSNVEKSFLFHMEKNKSGIIGLNKPEPPKLSP